MVQGKVLCENDVSLLAIHECRIGRFLESVAADQTMVSRNDPEVAELVGGDIHSRKLRS